jgi:hypothetical protein
VRKVRFYTLFMGIGLVLLGLMFIHSGFLDVSREAGVNRRRHWVGKLELSDLCLFTDARYARHLSMADLHTPFQDHPLSFEHFPSGSMIGPPPHLKGNVLR